MRLRSVDDDPHMHQGLSRTLRPLREAKNGNGIYPEQHRSRVGVPGSHAL